jgi:hypothetical protein
MDFNMNTNNIHVSVKVGLWCYLAGTSDSHAAELISCIWCIEHAMPTSLQSIKPRSGHTDFATCAMPVQIIVDTKHLGFRPSEAPRRFKQKALGIAQVSRTYRYIPTSQTSLFIIVHRVSSKSNQTQRKSRSQTTLRWLWFPKQYGPA